MTGIPRENVRNRHIWGTYEYHWKCCVLARWRSNTRNGIIRRIYLYMETVRNRKDVDSMSSTLKFFWSGQVYCMVDWWVIFSLEFWWRNNSEMEHVIRRMRIGDTNTWPGWPGKCSFVVTWQQTRPLGWWDYLRLGFVNWPNHRWSFAGLFHSVFRGLLPKWAILRFWIIGRIRHRLGLDRRHKSFGSVQITLMQNPLDRLSSDKWNVRFFLRGWRDRCLGLERKHIWVHLRNSDYVHLRFLLQDGTRSIFARWKAHIEHALWNKRTVYTDR